MGGVMDFLEDHADDLPGYIYAGMGIVAAIDVLSDWLPEPEVSEDRGNYTGFNSASVNQQGMIISNLKKEKEEVIRKREKYDKKQKKNMDDWLAGTDTILKNIENYRTELFLPGCTDEMKEAAAQAKELFESDAKQAALAAAYRAYSLAKRTEETLLNCELEWEKAYAEYLKSLEQTELLLSNCSDYKIKVRTSEGAEIVGIDVDHWTDGRLKNFQPHVIASDILRMRPTEDIRRMTAEIEETRERIRELLPEAAAAFSDSQQRIEMCEAVFSFFQQRGFRLCSEKSYGYEDEDDRKPVFLRIQNAVEDEVSFTFSKNGGFAVATRFHKVKNRDLQQYLLRLCLDALAEAGFTVTEFQDMTA